MSVEVSDGRKSRLERIDRFVSQLEELAGITYDGRPGREDRAALARLRRCAGRPPEDSLDILPLLYRMMQQSGMTLDARESDPEADCLLVATLFPFAPRPWRPNPEAERPEPTDFGRSLRRLARQEDVNADGIDRKVTVMLDASRDELTYRLRQAVRMLAQHESVRVDWRQLLADLGGWNLPSRSVQKQWARSYFGLRDEEPASGGPDDSAAMNDTRDEETNDAN